MALRGVIEADEEAESPEDHAALEAALAATLADTLDALKLARLEEGAALAPVLSGVVGRIAALAARAEVEAAAQPLALKARFEKRMAELVSQAGLEDRIVQEAAMLAMKADVREDLDRLSAHVEAAGALLAGDLPAGRRLDFLAQEFMREVNTLCAKAATKDLTAVGLELKAAVEQLREQVQNVE